MLDWLSNIDTSLIVATLALAFFLYKLRCVLRSLFQQHVTANNKGDES